MKDNSADSIIKGFEKAKSDRTQWETGWEDIYYYTNHRRRGVTTKYEAGDRKNTDIYDSTAEHANLILAAGLAGYMTNASQRWFEIRPRDEGLLNIEGARSFFTQASDSIYSVLAASNFYNQIHELYLDLGSAGLGGMMVEEDATENVRFYARHPRELFLIEDDKERVNIAYRLVEFTAWKAFTKWGENCGEAIKKCIEQGDHNKKFEFVHYICPRHVRDVKKIDRMNKPFADYWVSMDDKKIMEEGGYDEFPLMTPRFYKNSEDTYGYSPAWVSFPEIKMLNKSVELWIKRVEREVYPPLITEHDGIIGTIDLRGAAINYQRRPLSQGKAIDSIVMGGQYNLGMDFILQTRDIISKNYFVDLFLTIMNKPNMTATEVIERTQEKMLMLGPVLGRLQSELLNPVINRTFNILFRRGLLPQVPPELQGVEFDVVYVSPLAKAQRAAQARDTQAFLGIVGQMAAIAPDVLDKVDSDTVVDKLSKMYSIDPDILRGSDEIAAIRDHRSKMAEQQQQMATMQQIGGMAKDYGKAMKDGQVQGTQV